MSLSKESKEILVVSMANRAKANEISGKIEAIESALNSVLAELEALRDAAGTVDSKAAGFWSGLKI